MKHVCFLRMKIIPSKSYGPKAHCQVSFVEFGRSRAPLHLLALRTLPMQGWCPLPLLARKGRLGSLHNPLSLRSACLCRHACLKSTATRGIPCPRTLRMVSSTGYSSQSLSEGVLVVERMKDKDQLPVIGPGRGNGWTQERG